MCCRKESVCRESDRRMKQACKDGQERLMLRNRFGSHLFPHVLIHLLLQNREARCWHWDVVLSKTGKPTHMNPKLLLLDLGPNSGCNFYSMDISECPSKSSLYDSTCCELNYCHQVGFHQNSCVSRNLKHGFQFINTYGHLYIICVFIISTLLW